MPKKSIIPVFVPHLGCAHDCVFCNQRRISGQTEPMSALGTDEAIRRALDKIGDGAEAEIAFYGGSFTAIPQDEQEALLGVAARYISEGRVCSVRLSTRPDCIDRDTLGRLKRYGVGTIELGSQSMCDDVLKKSGRGHTAEDTKIAAALIKESGFSLILQMMTGLPGDTREKALFTAHEIAALEPSGVRIYPTVIVRDTVLHELWKSGAYAEHTVEEAVEWCADIVPIFEDAGITVIRLGLNPTEALSGGDAAGGAYHPALGELVRSSIYLRRAKAAIEAHGGKASTLGVERSQISMAVGQKRCNILELERKFGLCGLKIIAADVKRGEIAVIE